MIKAENMKELAEKVRREREEKARIDYADKVEKYIYRDIEPAIKSRARLGKSSVSIILNLDRDISSVSQFMRQLAFKVDEYGYSSDINEYKKQIFVRWT